MPQKMNSPYSYIAMSTTPTPVTVTTPPTHIVLAQIAALTAATDELRAQIAALTAENRQMREQLAASAAAYDNLLGAAIAHGDVAYTHGDPDHDPVDQL